VTLIVLAALVVLLGVAPLVIPIPPLKSTLPVEQLADADSRFFECQGLRVHYKQAGHALGVAERHLRTPQVRRLGPLFTRSIATLGERTLASAWADPAHIPPDAIALYRKPLQADNWDRALWEFTLASQPAGLDARLGELTMPVLVISGDQDRIVPLESSLRLADALGVTPVVIAAAGHLPHEEQPAQFLQAVSPFVASLP